LTGTDEGSAAYSFSMLALSSERKELL